MKVLIVGGGGREHALAWKIAQSPRVTELFVAPGNPGTARLPRTRNLEIAAHEVAALAQWALQHGIDLAIVGPEAPLALGIVDHFTEHGLRCFGPTRAAAELETSKAYAKDFMVRHGIPTARSVTVDNLEAARAALDSWPLPVVLKADGLAAGKGVVIATSREEAYAVVNEMLGGRLVGDAGRRIVIEEFLAGEELSFIVMAAEGQVLALADARDHKRRDDGDRGPNTGGMGAYSPVPGMELLKPRILDEVIMPTLRGLAADGRPYTGFLYAGLMIAQGRLSVLEFNCRLGDPETQVILPRLRSDLIDLIEAALGGTLEQQHADWDPRSAITVVLASRGYPGPYDLGLPIAGLGSVGDDDLVFHSGTALRDRTVVTAGGRVLCVGALGEDLAAARTRAYRCAAKISFDGGFCRRDIGIAESLAGG